MLKCKKDMICCPDDDGEIKWPQQWCDSRNKVCVSIKAKYYWLSWWGKEVAWWFTSYTHSEISVSAASMSPTAQPFDRRNFPLKKKLKKTMGLSLIPRYILTISNDVCKNNFYARPEVSHLAISHLCSLEMGCHTHRS